MSNVGANNVMPYWDAKSCIQCNWCSLVCPSGAIRPFVLKNTEVSETDNFCPSKDDVQKHYMLAISPQDCTGCGSCSEICPSFKKALLLNPADIEYAKSQQESFDRLTVLRKNEEHFYKKLSVKDIQFYIPQGDFSSFYPDEAAAPYIKLISQIFGKDLVVADSSGALEAPEGAWVFNEAAYANDAELKNILASGNNLNVMLFGAEKDFDPEVLAESIGTISSVCVASVSIAADPAQTLAAIYEAAEHSGPSVILAYAVSAEKGAEAGKIIETARNAVKAGRWKLSSLTAGALSAPNELICEDIEDGEYAWMAVNMATEKEPMPEQTPEVRITNFNEGKLGYTADMAVREAMRCLNCRKKPCMLKGCPVSNRIPDFIQKVAASDFKAAHDVLCETSCLPAVCGRVCQQDKQCEGSCVRGIKGEPVAIGNLERFVADWHRKNIAESELPTYNNGHRVAIVGSGPAGIACADSLADMGYAVTIYEKDEFAGGVLTYGIPEFRLPADITNAEIAKLSAKGINIVTGVTVGADITIESLCGKDGYDAVFLACGADIPARMNIPGEALDGVWVAKDYLAKVNMDKALELPGAMQLPRASRIAVIGGGNVAMDACRTAARSGAEKVCLIYRRSEMEIPADQSEIQEAKEEGVEFVYLTKPIAVIGENGKVAGLECVKMELAEEDSTGRRKAYAIDGSNFTLMVDCVIAAVGYRVDPAVSEAVSMLNVNAYGGICTDEFGCTGVPGLFAGGDVVTGPASVVKAMGAGKIAAQSIDKYIQSKS